MSKILPYEKIRSWIRKNNIVDVALFGSANRGKDNPRDIDLCILIEDRDEDRSIDISHSLKELLQGFNVHASIITSSSFVKGDTLARTVLYEGYSIRQGKTFSQNFNLKNRTLFQYNLKNFNPSKRVRFHYALNGRNKAPGLLKGMEGRLLSPGTIVVPTEKEDSFKRVMEYWEVDYSTQRVLMD